MTHPGPSAWSELQQALTAAVGPGVGVVLSGVDGDPDRLHPLERAAMGRAIVRRQREYAAGREAARRAMRLIGWPEAPVPSAPDRSPQWPPGLIGSISHTRDACLVLVAPCARFLGIGVDIDMHEPVEPHLWPLICTPAEQEALVTWPESERGLAVIRLFSAKEAVFKWQFPLHGRMLDFQHVHIGHAQGNSTFVAHIDQGNDPRVHPHICTQGKILCCGEHVVSWVITPQDQTEADLQRQVRPRLNCLTP